MGFRIDTKVKCECFNCGALDNFGVADDKNGSPTNIIQLNPNWKFHRTKDNAFIFLCSDNCFTEMMAVIKSD